MTAAEKKMHNHFSIMHFHAQIMHFFVLEKNRYAKLSTEVHAGLGLEHPRQGLGNDRTSSYPRGQDILYSRLAKFAGFYLKRLYNIHAPLYDIFEP